MSRPEKGLKGKDLYNYTSKTFRTNYVYYKDLWKWHPELYTYAKYHFNAQSDKLSYWSKLPLSLIKLAEAERDKEIRFLKKIFNKAGIDTDTSLFLNWDSSNSGASQLIRAINECLSTKEIFERNLTLIRESNGQKGVYTWFAFYFGKEADKFFETATIDTFIKLGANSNSSLQEMIDDTKDKWLEIITQNALRYMITEAKAESGIKTNRKKHKDAYLTLLNRIGDFSTPGTLAAEMNEIYGIKNVENEIVAEIVNNLGNKTKNLKLEAKLVGSTGNDGTQDAGQGVHSKGGFAMEAWIDNIMRVKINNSNATTFRADGPHGKAKADIMTMFDINVNYSNIERIIQEGTTNFREKNIELNTEIINSLDPLAEEGFIVYTSAKNYTLNGKYDISAGESVTVSTFLKTLSKVQNNIDTLSGLILQYTKGSAFEHAKTTKENLTTILAQYIAYFLFDDFEEIGAEKDNGVNGIHLLNINGVFFPLSVFLFILARAMKEGDKQDINKIVRVTLQPSEVIYKLGGHKTWREAYLPDTPPQAWNKQKEHALDNFKISVHFLRSFADIMRTMNI